MYDSDVIEVRGTVYVKLQHVQYVPGIVQVPVASSD
jgi:hypothetical protein